MLIAYCLLSLLQGKIDAAASMIEKAIIANPTYAEAYNNLGLFELSHISFPSGSCGCLT